MLSFALCLQIVFFFVFFSPSYWIAKMLESRFACYCNAEECYGGISALWGLSGFCGIVHLRVFDSHTHTHTPPSTSSSLPSPPKTHRLLKYIFEIKLIKNLTPTQEVEASNNIRFNWITQHYHSILSFSFPYIILWCPSYSVFFLFKWVSF